MTPEEWDECLARLKAMFQPCGHPIRDIKTDTDGNKFCVACLAEPIIDTSPLTEYDIRRSHELIRQHGWDV